MCLPRQLSLETVYIKDRLCRRSRMIAVHGLTRPDDTVALPVLRAVFHRLPDPLPRDDVEFDDLSIFGRWAGVPDAADLIGRWHMIARFIHRWRFEPCHRRGFNIAS